MVANPLSTVWFYNSDTGSVISEPALGDTIQSHLPGWHGPFGTKQEALNYYSQNKSANPSWKAPAGLGASVTNAVTNATGNLLGLPQLSNLRDLVVRSVKVIIGALLIIIGVNSLLKNEGIDIPKPPAVIPV